MEATEHERLQEMIVLLDNLTCETRFNATQATLPIRLFGHLPADKEDLCDTIRSFMSEADEDALRKHRMQVAPLMMPTNAVPDPMTPLLDTTKNASMSPRHNLSWGRDFNPLA